MIRIGEFARLAKLSVKQLRHYHDIGLLRAETVDAGTGYRYYEFGQLARLNRVLVYRSLGFSSRDIKRLVDDDTSVEELRDMLFARRAALAARVAAEQAHLTELEARIGQIEAERRKPSHEVSIHSVEPQTAVSLRRICGSYEEVGEMLKTLRGSAPRAAKVVGHGAIWHRCLQSGVIDCEALLFLASDSPALNARRVLQLPACTVASVMHGNDDPDPARLYGAVLQRAKMMGFRIGGPMREMYFGDCGSRGGMTEAQFPLAS